MLLRTSNKKLPDDQITALESWAEAKKKTAMTATEQNMVETIENMKKNNWTGYRLDCKTDTKESAESQLKQLREKRI